MFRTGTPFANIPANMQMKYMQIMQIYNELLGDMRGLYTDFSCDASGNRVAVLSGPRVRIPPTPPSHPNTLDQWAKSPVISRCSGLFMLENFQSIRWLNGNAAEVQTGFEPLLFHIQAESYLQRPFSEGCCSEILEKIKENLSQSYGRWIVGFHEPSPAPFSFARKIK